MDAEAAANNRSAAGAQAALLAAALLAGCALSPHFAALGYLASAAGLGLPLIKGDRFASRVPLAFAIGLAALLSVSFFLGVTGLLGVDASRWIALAVLAPGIWLLSRELVGLGRIRASDVRVSRPEALALLAAAVAVVVSLLALSTAPDVLWDSEFGGFDALSYHLQLPSEWLRSASTMPVEHNVYSYLPGYLEHAAHHLHVGLGHRGEHLARTPALITMQWLHGGLLLASALLAGAAARSLNEQASGVIAGAVVVATPWAVVVGTLAYNEMGVVALGLGAVLAVVRIEKPLYRGVAVGALVGVACGVKPTAIFMLAPSIGVLMLGLAPMKDWPKLIGGACLAGLCAIAPWLVRNWIAAGNPVFPAMTGVFGSGHWSAEQAARFAANHTFDGSMSDRLSLLFLPDASDPAGARHRGLLHFQWFLLFPSLVLAAAAGLLDRGTHRVAALLSLGLLTQLAAWLMLTHVQSRFLLPCLVLAAPLIGVALSGCKRAWAGAGVALLQAVGLVLVLIGQQGWPAAIGIAHAELVVDRPGRSGGVSAQEIAAATNARYAAGLIALDPGLRLCLLGPSTPLYLASDVVYTTTWDRHPFAEAVAASPDDPAAWTAALAELGVTHVLIDLSELSRLENSGYLDPNLATGERRDGPVRRWLRSGEGFRVLGNWTPGRVIVELTGSEQ